MRWTLAAITGLAGCGFGSISATESGSDGGEEQVADGGPDAPDGRARPDDYPRSYDMHHLLDDDQIFGGDDIDADEVQQFLASKESALVGYTDPFTGDTAAQIIADKSHAYGVSPLYMIARIQTESQLITSGTEANIDAATGCGCPDGQGCDPELGGFANQVECAAEKMSAYWAELEADGVTRAGWRVGVGKETFDPCLVTPANRATALLYTYTPWVGAYADQCGTEMWGGSSLVALAYHRYWVEFDWSL